MAAQALGEVKLPRRVPQSSTAKHGLNNDRTMALNRRQEFGSVTLSKQPIVLLVEQERITSDYDWMSVSPGLPEHKFLDVP